MAEGKRAPNKPVESCTSYVCKPTFFRRIWFAACVLVNLIKSSVRGPKNASLFDMSFCQISLDVLSGAVGMDYMIICDTPYCQQLNTSLNRALVTSENS